MKLKLALLLFALARVAAQDEGQLLYTRFLGNGLAAANNQSAAWRSRLFSIGTETFTDFAPGALPSTLLFGTKPNASLSPTDNPVATGANDPTGAGGNYLLILEENGPLTFNFREPITAFSLFARGVGPFFGARSMQLSFSMVDQLLVVVTVPLTTDSTFFGLVFLNCLTADTVVITPINTNIAADDISVAERCDVINVEGPPNILNLPCELFQQFGPDTPTGQPEVTFCCPNVNATVTQLEDIIDFPSILGTDCYSVTRTWDVTFVCLDLPDDPYCPITPENDVVTVTQILGFEDTTPPCLHAPGNLFFQCAFQVPAGGVANATDNCDAGVTGTDMFTKVVLNQVCPDRFTLSRTFQVTDFCNNTATETQFIFVFDNTPPTVIAPPNQELECNEPIVVGTPIVFDNCGEAVTVVTTTTVFETECPSRFTQVTNFTATDQCGNSAWDVTIISVDDSFPPVLNGVPASTTVPCNAIPPVANVTASDLCDPNPILTFCETMTPGGCPFNFTLTRTWTAIDACGNIATATQIIHVIDISPPVIDSAFLAPVHIVVKDKNIYGSSNSYAQRCNPPHQRLFQVVVNAHDNCDPNPHITAQLIVRNTKRIDGHHNPYPNPYPNNQPVMVVDPSPIYQVPNQPIYPRRDGLAVPFKKDDNFICINDTRAIPVEVGSWVDIILIDNNFACLDKKSLGFDKDDNFFVGWRFDNGVLHIVAEQVVLRVTVTDSCGNSVTTDFDPAVMPSPLCEELSNTYIPPYNGIHYDNYERSDWHACCPAIAPGFTSSSGLGNPIVGNPIVGNPVGNPIGNPIGGIKGPIGGPINDPINGIPTTPKGPVFGWGLNKP